MSCTVVDLYKSIKKCPGQKVMPGIRPKVYYILKSNIVVWPSLADAVTADMGDIATYTGNFTLAEDKKWLRLDLVDMKSNITAETQGEPPSATSLNKGTFVVGGTDAEITGFGRAAINDPLVFLVQDRDGKFRVLGNEMYDSIVKVSQDSGTGVTDQKRSTVEVEVTDLCAAPFYGGKIESADDGNISGADGSAIAAGG